MGTLLTSWRSRLGFAHRTSRHSHPTSPRRPGLRLEPLEDRLLPSTYYVSPSGNDRNNGLSANHAWRTISKVNSFTFQAGDAILFQGGATFTGNLSFNAADSGTAAAPIRISSYGSGRATLNAGTGTGIFVYQTGGYVISNLNLRGSGYANGNRGSSILFYTDQVGQRAFVRIDQVDVAGFNNGILVESWRTDGQVSGYTDVRVTNAAVHDLESNGIMFWTPMPHGSSNVYVGHATAYNIPGHAGMAAAGITLQDLDNATVERSIAHDVGANSDAGPAGFSVLDSSNVTLQYLESYQNKKPSGKPDGDGIDLDGGTTNSVVQYCYVHDNQGPGITLTQYGGGLGTNANNTVRYNILQNNGTSGQHEGGIQIWGASATYQVTNDQIYNNTIYTTGVQYGLLAMGSYANLAVRDNLFVNAGGYQVGVYDSLGGLLLQGNDYWTYGGSLAILYGGASYSSLDAFRAGTGQETFNGSATGCALDPQLNNPGGGGTIGNPDQLSSLTAYKLKASSPLVNAGLNLQSSFGINPGPHDYYGAAILLYGAGDIGVS
jgi:hypothetical protein